jgi:hypothetical protein
VDFILLYIFGAWCVIKHETTLPLVQWFTYSWGSAKAVLGHLELFSIFETVPTEILLLILSYNNIFFLIYGTSGGVLQSTVICTALLWNYISSVWKDSHNPGWLLRKYVFLDKTDEPELHVWLS